jgi:hypothetical protein
MAEHDKDASVLAHIERLVSEEHKLFNKQTLEETETKRLKDLQVQLDQCWDLLRQRRAARETGHDPSKAEVRPAGIVEGYEG